MVLICLDYLYRDLTVPTSGRSSTTRTSSTFSTRQTLDTIFVVQCNPKPEHRAYRDVLSGSTAST